MLLVCFGGGLGAVARYLLSGVINKKSHPWGTFVVNVLGCIVFGICIKLFLLNYISSQLKIFLLSGVCGGFTTFSTFSSETAHLLLGNKLDIKTGLQYLIASILIGLLGLMIGYFLPNVFS